MAKRIAALAALLIARAAFAQGWLGEPPSPCTEEPPPGLLLRVDASEEVTRSGNGWRYAYTVRNRSDSRASVRGVLFQMLPSPAFEAIDGWSVVDQETLDRLARTEIKFVPAFVATFDPHGRFDVRPGGAVGIAAESEKYPGIAILRVYPRRQMPCLPNDEEAKILDAKGMHFDESLADEATYTVGIPVLAPVFDASEMKKKGGAVLLSSALDQLRALEPFLPMSYGARTKGFTSPTYDGQARGTAARLEDLRDQALRDVRPENRSAVLRLCDFYSALEPDRPRALEASPK